MSLHMMMVRSWSWCSGFVLPKNNSVVIQTHKRFKRTLIYYDIDNTMQIFMEIPLFQATKWYLNNSEMVKNNEKWYERWSNIFFCCCVQCLPEECWHDNIMLWDPFFRMLAVILVSDFCWYSSVLLVVHLQHGVSVSWHCFSLWPQAVDEYLVAFLEFDL